MPIYKALITDLDGTAIKLSSNGDDVSDLAKQSIQEAEKNGYKITCATGRRWSFTKPIVNKLGITSACIVQGGSRIIDPVTEKTLWEKHLDTSAVAAVFDIFKRESEDGVLSTFNLRRKPLSSFDKPPEDARFMYLLNVPQEVATNVCNAINSQGFAVAHMTLSWDGDDKLDIHVTNPEATKEHAIKVWQKMEGVTKAQTIGMGDSGNDVPLFQSAGFKIAVGNATDELKHLADFIAPNQDKEALAYVINRFMPS